MKNDRNKQQTCLLHTEMVAEPFLAGVLVTDFCLVTGAGFCWGFVSGDGEDDRRSCWLKKKGKGNRKVSTVEGLKCWVSDRPVKGGGGCRSFVEEEGRRRREEKEDINRG
ncbi:hypothetical protein E3N88_08032 [Mikania micrantha]|uniref:Uncharacterized protein n=1 Tax=Mikania micrantha TaxID=192012 RepID=A0A5N6PG41_9ASTR|nr:hypothetical protein E3N88_08032 [Mikania micrantha]